ncbi:MAG TPA: lysylphosphatidylglycerol synthase transmembrane domain-containing protein [Anaerolineales bacterium]|nr:lysylphosphatidylglycerol synthase transmembrane domain-containing protein [Anaerolineales bacterium]
MGKIDLAAQREPSAGRDWRRVIPGFAISAISILVIVLSVDFSQVAAALRLADYRLIGLGLLITLAWLLVRGLLWRTLLEGKAPLSTVFLTLNEGYLLNNVLPFRLGEIGRAFLLSRKTGLDFWRVLSSILIERSLDIAFAVGLLLSTLPFVVGASWARQAALGAGILILATFVVMYLLGSNRERALIYIARLSERWPRGAHLLGRAVPAFLSGLEVLTNRRRFFTAIVLMLGDWVIGVTQYYVIMQAFFPGAKLLWSLFTLGVAALGVAAPSTPGALGVFELAVLGALQVFGLNPSVSLAYAVILHIEQYLVTAVIGVYALSRDGESLLGLYQRVRELRKNGSQIS